MYNHWLRIIEDKMGYRVREALEKTIWIFVFVLAWAALIISVGLALIFFVASFIESAVYILHFIVCLAFTVVSTFFVYLCME